MKNKLQENSIKQQLPKDYISVAQLNAMYKCGEFYRQRYVKGKPFKSNIRMVIGNAVHLYAKKLIQGELKAPEKTLQETGQGLYLLSRDELSELLLDEVLTEREEDFDYALKKIMTPEEWKDKIATLDYMTERVSIYCELYKDEIYPRFKDTTPIAELDANTQLDTGDGYPITIFGKLDIVMPGVGFRDLKVMGKKPAAGVADASLQFTSYAYWWYKKQGVIPEIYQDTIVGGKKKIYAMEPIKTVRTFEHLQAYEKRLEVFIRAILNKSYLPAGPDNWWCGPGKCDFAGECMYVCNPETIKEVA